MECAPASSSGRWGYKEWPTRSDEQSLSLGHLKDRDDLHRVVPWDWPFRLRASGLLARRSRLHSRMRNPTLVIVVVRVGIGT
jgi:hypothetical protein